MVLIINQVTARVMLTVLTKCNTNMGFDSLKDSFKEIRIIPNYVYCDSLPPNYGVVTHNILVISFLCC